MCCHEICSSGSGSEIHENCCSTKIKETFSWSLDLISSYLFSDDVLEHYQFPDRKLGVIRGTTHFVILI